MIDVYIEPRDDFAFFVFWKGRSVPVDRFDTPEAAHREMQKLMTANPGHTFILAREICRGKGLGAALP